MSCLGPLRPKSPGVGTWYVQVSSSLISHINIGLDRCTHTFPRAPQNRAFCGILHFWLAKTMSMVRPSWAFALNEFNEVLGSLPSH